MRMRAATVLLGMTLAVTGCSGNEDAAPVSSPPTSASDHGAAGPTEVATASARDQSDKVNGHTPGQPRATSTGSVKSRGKSVAVQLEVLDLRTDDRSTVMQLRITPSEELDMRSLKGLSLSSECADQITLVDTGTQQEYLPASSPAGPGSTAGPACLGANAPHQGDPQHPIYLYAYYGPLPSGLSTVEVRAPGFAPVNVPVTRD